MGIEEAVDVKGTSGSSADGIGTTASPQDVETQTQGGGDTTAIQGDGKEEQAVPYARFKEVNDKKNELEKFYEEVDGNLDGMVNERVGKLLQDSTFQKQYYEQLKKIYGSEEAKQIVKENVQQAKAGQPVTLPPEIQQKLAKIDELLAWKKQQDDESMLLKASEAVDTEMQKHPIFREGIFASEEYADIVNNFIAGELNRNRAMPMSVVVANAAKKMAGLVEKSRTSYVESKANAGKTVPSTVKGGSGAPAGKQTAPKGFDEATASFVEGLKQSIASEE